MCLLCKIPYVPRSIDDVDVIAVPRSTDDVDVIALDHSTVLLWHRKFPRCHGWRLDKVCNSPIDTVVLVPFVFLCDWVDDLMLGGLTISLAAFPPV